MAVQYDANQDGWYDDGQPDQGYPPASDFAVMPDQGYPPASDFAVMPQGMTMQQPPPPVMPPMMPDPNYSPRFTAYDPHPQPPPVMPPMMPDPNYNPYPQPWIDDPLPPPPPSPPMPEVNPNYSPYYNLYEQYGIPVMPSGYDNQSTGIPVMPSGYPPSRAKYGPGAINPQMLAHGISGLVSALSGMTGNRTPSGGSTPGYGQQLPPRLVRP